MTSPAANADPLPPVSAQAMAAGLVDVRSAVPDAVVPTSLCHHEQLRRSAAVSGRHTVPDSPGPRTGAGRCRGAGPRPGAWCWCSGTAIARTTSRCACFGKCLNPNWVARPSDYARSHEAGRSVDVTLADAHYVRLVDMGTDFDDFTPRSHALAADGVTGRATGESCSPARRNGSRWAVGVFGRVVALRRPRAPRIRGRSSMCR